MENPSDAIRRSVTAGDMSTVLKGSVLNIIIPFYPGGDAIPLPPEPPPGWSKDRDDILRATLFKETMWAGAIGIAISKMASQSWDVTSSVSRRANEARDLLMHADFNAGWVAFLSRHLRDYLLTDNGSFIELVRETGSPASRIRWLHHLDSRRCLRTGDPDIPVLYTDRRGRIHELKHWQVLAMSDMPDPSDTYYGVGFCAASRAYASIYKLAAVEWYYREKIAGLHPLAIHIVNGLVQEQLTGAVASAKENAQARGVSSYMGAVIVGVPSDISPSLVTIPLADLPAGFDRKQEFDISVLAYANAIGLDPQDLQPLTGQNLGTGAQSRVLADKAQGRGLSAWKQQFTHLVNEFVLPDSTYMTFVEKDLRDQMMTADIQSRRATASATRITAAITTPEEEKQILSDAGDIPSEFLSRDETPVKTVSDEEKPEVAEQANAIQAVQQEKEATVLPRPELSDLLIESVMTAAQRRAKKALEV